MTSIEKQARAIQEHKERQREFNDAIARAMKCENLVERELRKQLAHLEMDVPYDQKDYNGSLEALARDAADKAPIAHIEAGLKRAQERQRALEITREKIGVLTDILERAEEQEES